MSLKKALKDKLMEQLNNNNYDLNFRLGNLGQLNSSSFAIQTTSDEWYKIEYDEFIPVVTNTFDAVYLLDNQFQKQIFTTEFSFLVRTEQQTPFIEFIEEFIENTIGVEQQVATDFNVMFEPSDIEFSEVLTLNDIRFVEYILKMDIQVANNANFGHSYRLFLKKNADAESEWTELNFVQYTPVRTNQSVASQKVGTNSSTSIVQSSNWAATIEFFQRTAAYYGSSVVGGIINLLEDSTQPMNTVYNLRVYNPYTQSNFDKDIIITSVVQPVIKNNNITITMNVEEANTEVL